MCNCYIYNEKRKQKTLFSDINVCNEEYCESLLSFTIRVNNVKVQNTAIKILVEMFHLVMKKSTQFHPDCRPPCRVSPTPGWSRFLVSQLSSRWLISAGRSPGTARCHQDPVARHWSHLSSPLQVQYTGRYYYWLWRHSLGVDTVDGQCGNLQCERYKLLVVNVGTCNVKGINYWWSMWEPAM